MGDLVSVILPTFNRPGAVIDCIKAIRLQTYKPIEIIVVDDASKLQYNIPVKFKAKYFKLRRNIGPAGARNFGLSKAGGEFIIFLDDDITLTSTCVEILLKTLTKFKQFNVGAVACRLIYVQNVSSEAKGKQLLRISKLTGDITLNSSLDAKEPIFAKTLHSCALFSREVFSDVGLWDDKTYVGNYTYAEPDFYYRMGAHGWKLLFEPRAVAKHLRIQEAGCRSMSPAMYKYYTLRNALFFQFRHYGFKTAYMWPAFVFKKITTVFNSDK